MRRYITLAGICLIVICSLTACGNTDPDPQEIVSEGLGISVSDSEVISYWDDHGGFHGDGTTFITLQFSGDDVLEEILESGEWSAFPLDETVEILVYGKEYEWDEESLQYGPYVTDDNFNPIFPEVENGYYRLIDRYTSSQGEEDTDILNRDSYNFTLGIYDTDTDILYYCKFDT